MSETFKTRDDVLRYVRDQRIEIVDLWFTDILGYIKSCGMTPHELEEALEEGLGFDGSSVEGFARIYESDMIMKPDPKTFRVFPWEVNGSKKARMICDVLNPDGTPYDGDPRWILRRNLEKIGKQGYTMNVGPELEYFYLKNHDSTEVLDVAGYFDLMPYDVGSELRQRTIAALHHMGIQVEVGHHEVAPSQHEIDMKYADALAMADYVITYRFLVKEIARLSGCYATFMPKPIFGVNGSGMHVHQSLFKGSENAFFEQGAKWNLSRTGKSYLAGILEHAEEIVAITNQWVNSYKRLVPGYEAPVYVAWGQKNRSALVRVPMYKPGKAKATRIEFRCPDPATNPYLAFTVMLAAGMKGIEGNYTLREPVEEDIYHMSESERRERGIKSLPDSLYSSLEHFEKSALCREALGEHIFNKFIENKRIEWDRYRIAVTEYEIKEYLPVL